MQIIDLVALGTAVFDRFFHVGPRLIASTMGQASCGDDDISRALAGTPFRVGSIEVDASANPNDWHVRETPLVVHPELGAWFVEVSEDDDPYPEFEEWRFETYFQSWCGIAETFGWSEPPMRPLIVYTQLDRRQCISDFSQAPFGVYFRDDLHRLPQILADEAEPVGIEIVKSLMGALQSVAHVVSPEGLQIWSNPVAAPTPAPMAA